MSITNIYHLNLSTHKNGYFSLGAYRTIADATKAAYEWEDETIQNIESGHMSIDDIDGFDSAKGIVKLGDYTIKTIDNTDGVVRTVRLTKNGKTIEKILIDETHLHD